MVAEGKHRRIGLRLVSAIATMLAAFIAALMATPLGFTTLPAVMVARLTFVALAFMALAIGALVMTLAYRLRAGRFGNNRLRLHDLVGRQDCRNRCRLFLMGRLAALTAWRWLALAAITPTTIPTAIGARAA